MESPKHVTKETVQNAKESVVLLGRYTHSLTVSDMALKIRDLSFKFDVPIRINTFRKVKNT